MKSLPQFKIYSPDIDGNWVYSGRTPAMIGDFFRFTANMNIYHGKNYFITFDLKPNEECEWTEIKERL